MRISVYRISQRKERAERRMEGGDGAAPRDVVKNGTAERGPAVVTCVGRERIELACIRPRPVCAANPRADDSRCAELSLSPTSLLRYTWESSHRRAVRFRRRDRMRTSLASRRTDVGHSCGESNSDCGSSCGHHKVCRPEDDLSPCIFSLFLISSSI